MRKIMSLLLALCLVVGMIPLAASAAEGDVAAVGSTSYPTLAQAVDAAQSGQTITLITDTDISESGLTIPGEKSLTLDLNGNNLKAANTNTGNIKVYGNLTIKDSATSADGKIYTETTYTNSTTGYGLINAIGEKASIILESGYIDAASFTQNPSSEGQFGIGVDAGGDFTMMGGKIEAGWYAVSGNGNNSTQHSVIKIQGGELISTADYAVYLPQSGETTISGGTIYGAAGGISLQRGILNISGDALITSKGTGSTGEWGDGTGGQDSAALNIAAEYGDCTVSISGGKLTAEEEALIIKADTSHTSNLSVTGGTFSSNVSEYISDEYTVVETENGFEVQKLGADNAVASVGTGENVNYYKTVAEAVENANNGMVTLLQNAAFDTLSLSSGVVIVDLNGHTLTSTSGETSIIANGANLTIQDSKGTGTLVYNGITDPAKAAFEVQVGSSITLKGIHYKTSGTGIYAWGNAATINVQGVVIDSKGYCVGTNAGKIDNYRVDINVTDSQLTSAAEGAGTAVLFNVPGTLEIDNSTLNGHWQGMIARGGTISVRNSVITNTYETLDTSYEETWGSGNAVTLAGIAIGNKGNNSYNYPVSITLDNTSVTSVGPNPAIYVYQMTGDKRTVTVAISGDSAVSGDFVVEKDESVESVDVTISGGYFTSNPSEYVAEGMAAVESDKEGYAYMVAEAGKTPAEVVPADPNVDTNLSVSEEDEKNLLESIKTSLGATGDGSTPPSLDADSLNAAALTVANKNTTQVDETLVDKLEEAISDSSELSTSNVTIVIQPYMDIKVTDVNSDGDQKSFTLDITPMYRKVAVKNDDGNVPDDIVTKEDAEGEGGSRVNAVVLENAVELPVKQPTEVVIPLPTGFTTGKTLYVLHDNRHYHQGAVESDVLTFTTEGFSPFTISTSAEIAAQIGDVYYGSLQDAVDNVQNGETVVLLKDQESATVDREVSFTISSQSGSSFTAAISAGAGYRNVGADNSYRFERIPSTPVNPGGDDDKPEEPAFPFTDVKPTAWYYNAVKYVYENNLMAGTGDTTFDPEVSLTRAMTAQILYNLEGQPKVDEEATFADMNEAPTWSVGAIAWAQDTGVVAGMGDNEFAPNAKVTREQFAQMMYNYAKYKKYDLTKTGDLSKFPDDGFVSDWAETAMSWANGNGLINGHEDSGLIDPAGNTIRGQAASIIMNFDLNVVK
jgi:hypothetical protein